MERAEGEMGSDKRTPRKNYGEKEKEQRGDREEGSEDDVQMDK